MLGNAPSPSLQTSAASAGVPGPVVTRQTLIPTRPKLVNSQLTAHSFCVQLQFGDYAAHAQNTRSSQNKNVVDHESTTFSLVVRCTPQRLTTHTVIGTLRPTERRRVLSRRRYIRTHLWS